MGANSSIEWTGSTWNPLTGCNKVSPGCKNCYAERLALRLQAMGQPNYRNGFKLTLQRNALKLPLAWKKPQLIFVNSMSDMYHKDVPLDYIQEIFDVMRRAWWHQFQVLTKRSERLLEVSPQIDWPDNVWQGVSVENQDYTFRIDHLKRTGAKIKFLSLEPLLGPLSDLNLTGTHWVIVGGESGPGARQMNRDWVLDIQEQCRRAGIAFFFKQTGSVWARQHGYMSGKGGEPSEWPADMRTREYPSSLVNVNMPLPGLAETAWV